MIPHGRAGARRAGGAAGACLVRGRRCSRRVRRASCARWRCRCSGSPASRPWRRGFPPCSWTAWPRRRLPLGLPWLPSRVRLDALSGFFLGVIGVVSVAVGLYGPAYVRGFEHGRESLAALGGFTGLFLAGMLLVVLADDAFLFMVAWEVMSLSSYFLVAFQHEQRRQPPRRLPLPADGAHRRTGHPARLRRARLLRRRIRLRGHARGAADARLGQRGVRAGVLRFRHEGGAGAAACLAAGGPPGRALAHLGAHVRRDAEGGGLRLHPRRVRPARRVPVADGGWRCSPSAASRR